MARATRFLPARHRGVALLTAMAIALGVAACDRAPDKSAAAKPELTPTTPAIGPPPAQPVTVMPPQASAVLEQPASSSAGAAAPSPDRTASGSDPNAKEPMTKAEESTAMPMPAQANDHSTLGTDAKK